ncbi:MAG: PqqD family protein [Candidatus Cryptobacteroides sp.]
MIVKDGPEVNLTDVFTLNETAADVWNAFSGKEFVTGDVAAYLVENYDVAEETAADDAASLMAEWEKFGLIVK